MSRLRRPAVLLGAALALSGVPAPAVAAPGPAPVPATTAPSAAQTRPLLDSARLWRERGRDDLAAAALRKLLAMAPGDRAALRLLVAIEIEAGRFATAARLLARLQEAWPDAPEARELSELLATARTQGRRAVRERLRAIDGLPLDPPQLAAARGAAPVRGRAAREAEAPAAIAASEPAGHAPSEEATGAAPAAATPDPAEQARALRAAADARAAQGDAAGARARLEEALLLDPRSAWVRFDLARLLLRAREATAARATIDAGLALAQPANREKADNGAGTAGRSLLLPD
jgi:Tfp pilus assembly protein PilF